MQIPGDHRIIHGCHFRRNGNRPVGDGIFSREELHWGWLNSAVWAPGLVRQSTHPKIVSPLI